jgi:hypothetical protein
VLTTAIAPNKSLEATLANVAKIRTGVVRLVLGKRVLS